MGFTADATTATEAIIDAFGDSYTFTLTVSGSGSSSTITCVYDNDHFVADELGNLDLDTREPIMWCKTSEASEFKQGDSVDISSASYLIESIEPDTHGLTGFRLRISDA